jgi:NADH-ubiquinone oxidoreductase chain 2
MIIHPSLALFYGFLIFRVFLVVSAESWFIVWVGLEINAIAFVPLILVKSNKYSSEARVKYFLVQAFGSVIIIRGLLLKRCNWASIEYLLAGGVILKIGGAPFHQWLPSMVEGRSWNCLIVLFVVQKISPLVAVTFLLKDSSYCVLIYVVIVCRSLVGRVGGLITPSLRKIMAYSSISHLGWAIRRLMISSLAWAGYYFIYSLVLFRVADLFNKEEAFSLNQLILGEKRTRGLIGLSLLSLGGLPPFRGFVPKFLVRVGLLQHGTYFIFVILLSGTFLSLFFYVRIVLSGLILRRGSSRLASLGRGLPKGLWLNTTGILVPRVVFFALLDFKLFKLWAFKAWKMHV